MQTMTIKTKQGQKTFLAITDGGLDWSCTEDASVFAFTTLKEASKLGFSETEFEQMSNLAVGQIMDNFDYNGVHVMRIR